MSKCNVMCDFLLVHQSWHQHKHVQLLCTSWTGNGESAIDNRPPSNIGRACVTTKEAKRKIITASER